MNYTIPFKHLDQTNISTAGGKGANLGEMTAAGFPVPAGFVLTTEAYKVFVQENGLQQQIIDLVHTVSVENPQSGEVVSQKICTLFMQAVMTNDLANEITSAYEQLTQNSSNAVAVRSSATAEDLPTASFAGQQDTYLNIQGDSALLSAVKKCWASLWTACAILYRIHQKIDPASVSIAVIVQQLIPADIAGILFTANPVTGQCDQILINASWGLGDAIVSGQVTPDTVIVDKSTWKILSRETTTKITMTVRTETSTIEQAVPQAKQKQQVLDDATALQLAHYGTQIEAHYDMPMDIEWAIAEGKISILQARPITSLPEPKPAPLQNVTWEPMVPNTLWMRRQIVEHMPEPLSPLFEDLYLRKGMDQTLDKFLDTMGEIGGAGFDFNAMIPYGFADTINGYAYTAGSYKMNWPNLKAILRIYSRIFRFFKIPAFDWDGVVLPQYRAIIARWGAIDLAEATDETLLSGISEMAAADSSYWFGSAMNLALSRIMDSVFDRLLKSSLIRYALPKPHPVSASFLRGFDSKVLEAQADMETLANTIRESAVLSKLVLNTEAEQLIETLTTHPDGQPVLDDIQHYLDEYGHQIYNLDFVEPTQNEEPLPMLLSLKALVENTPDQDVHTRQAQMAEGREALVIEIMQALNPLSRRLFHWAWKWTKHYAPYREGVMFYMGAAWPTLRKLAFELGKRLTDAGTIANPDDIYYLNSVEITTAIEARAKGQSNSEFIQLTHERRALREARKQLTPPAKVPERGRLKLGPIDLSIFDPTPSDAINEESILHGYAVSTGHVTAPASVIRSIEDFKQMKPGTILVCTTTTPAWTPLFSQAKGLVTDIGGALAHGSIVAREYGIPAVMGTGIATERIKSGEMITVDGDRGTVTQIDQFDPIEYKRIETQHLAKKQAAARKWKAILGLVTGGLILMWWWKKRH